MASGIQPRKSFSSRLRRLSAAALLLAAVLLGIFDAASLWNRHLPQKLHLPASFTKPYHLGLDLEGGAHLVYQADFSAVHVDSQSEAMAGLRDVVELARIRWPT